MEIIINFSTLTETVKRTLSVIGKHYVDAEGNPKYKDITLGSNEEPLLTDYFKTALVVLKTKTERFSSSTSDTTITLSFPSNHPTGNDTTIRDAFSAYCVSYALYSWLLVTAPTLAGKYLEDATMMQNSIIRLVYTKMPPKSKY